MDTKREKQELLISIDKYGSFESANGSTQTERITFTWNNINVFVTKGPRRDTGRFFEFIRRRNETGIHPEAKQILKNVNGIARPGEVLAIMGASGAGKTTLMNVLTSQSAPNMLITGVCCANGVPIDSNLRRKCAYVQQEDLFIGTLSVKEHLIFQALLRMDRKIPNKERMKRVDEVIRALGLSKCENTKIGIQGRIKGISGGEMKRLSFASEVITNPSIMFCDEPTSGLDSFMALNIVQALKELAQSGKTIICTIHQPSSDLYAMFDKLMLVAEGRVAFLGSPRQAESFFASLDVPCPTNFNPADYFLELLAIAPGREQACRDAVQTICDKFAQSELGTSIARETDIEIGEYTVEDYPRGVREESPYKSSWCTQLRVLLWRSWLSDMRDPLIIRMRVGQVIITELIVVLVYYGQSLTKDGVRNINGAIYLILINLALQHLFNTLYVFCNPLPLFLREHKNGMYRVDTFFLSKNITDLPLFVLTPLIIMFISYYAVGFNPDVSKLFIAVGITFLVANASVSLGYMISCLCNTGASALTVATTLQIPVQLFSGYLINFDAIPRYLRWLSYISWMRYSFESIMVNQWTGINYINCTGTQGCAHSGHEVLQSYHLYEENLDLDVGLIVVLLVVYRLIGYLALYTKAST
ncbi:protein white-like [Photinus pyralis]|uniref:protein white-like n=1 Tax=Photinus pyralis TaxID=7054 RepID=UPI0012671B9F|nr:protein white-like [Photinus pyralis]